MLNDCRTRDSVRSRRFASYAGEFKFALLATELKFQLGLFDGVKEPPETVEFQIALASAEYLRRILQLSHSVSEHLEGLYTFSTEKGTFGCSPNHLSAGDRVFAVAYYLFGQDTLRWSCLGEWLHGRRSARACVLVEEVTLR